MPFEQLGKDRFLDFLPERIRLDCANYKGSEATSKITDVKFSAIGNFTIVLIKTKTDDFFGISKRNPDDKVSPSVGLSIACVRALRDFLGKDEGYCRQRPTSKKKAARIRANAIVDSIYGLD